MSAQELEQKQKALDDLQKSFNEYVESSKELEEQLESALEEAAEKIDRGAEREAAAEKRATELQLKVDELTRSLASKPKERGNDYSNGSMDVDGAQLKIRKLENENEDLNNQVRVLEATVDDLHHRVQGLEEDTIFLKTDIESVTISRDEMEAELRQELDSLAKKLSTSENERRKLSDDIAAMTNKLMKDSNGHHDPADDRVQMLLFKQDKDISFIKHTLDALAEENSEAHKHNHHHHDTHSAQWHEKVEELRTRLRETDLEKQALDEQNHALRQQLEEFAHGTERNHEQLSHGIEQLGQENEQIGLENEQLGQENAQLAHENDLLKQEVDALTQETAELDDLRQQAARQQSDIEVLNERLRELEAAKEVLQLALKEQAVPKFETVGSYVSNVEISSSSYTSIEINNMTTTHVNITQIIQSGDKERMKAELLRLAQQYDSLRHSNTRMLNKLQALQGNIQVCCRTRPPSYQELASGGKICIDAADDTELMCYDGRSEVWKSFVFDKVWKADANQAEVFGDVEPMIVSVLDGYNACILAYGQTGSGKTFTMDGYGDQYGCNYRTIQKLFDLLILRKVQAEAHSARVEQLARESSRDLRILAAGKRKSSQNSSNVPGSPKGNSNTSDETDDTNSVNSADETAPFTFTLTVSMMEIYNEQVYDLLGASIGGGQSGGVALDIRQGPDNSVSVPGLQQMPVHSLQDVMSVFARGTSNRATSSTNLNEHSSRSHLIVQVDVTTQRGAEMPVRGRLNLVDLAGSERVGKSGATGATMKEAQHINKSLSALGDVMEALDQKSKHIPYRNSKLTYLLQHSLGGNSRTMMIVTVCPTDLTFEESLFTLQFATRVRNITVGPAQKQSNAKNLEVQMKALKAELKELKRSKQAVEDAMHELKKEQKKVPPSALMEAKLKTIEEARKAGEILMQQLNRQITECNVKLSDEKELKEQLTADLNLAQKNLKKALEQIKELTRANERLEMLLKKKENEIEALREQQERLPPPQPADSLRIDAHETPASSKPPPAPNSAPARALTSSARRLVPTASSASVLSGPIRKRGSIASMREFMLPTASSVAHVAASVADHAARSEEVLQATHGPTNPTTADHAMRRASLSNLLIVDAGNVSDSDSNSPPGGGRRSNNSSWQDVLAPTAARQAYVQATEAELAAKAEEARRSTPAAPRFSVSPAASRPARRDSEDGSVVTATRSVAESVQYVNPRGHTSWIDATAPTAARRASVAAAEQELMQRSLERKTSTHRPNVGRPFSVSPATSRGRQDDDGSVSTAPRIAGVDYITPKGHSSWEDALAPTAARKAALTAAEEEAARRAREKEQATHAVHVGRFSVSPGQNRWADADDGSAPKPVTEFQNPKGHSSWYDAMAPTAARQAAIAAAEAEHYASLDATHSPSAVARPWVPASKDPGRPPASAAQPQPQESYTYSEPARSGRAATASGAPSSTRDSSVTRPRTNPAVSTPTQVSTGAKRVVVAAPASTHSTASTRATHHSELTTNTTNTIHSAGLLASSSMVRRTTAVDANGTYSSRMPTLSVRSEEAMKRHQMRMDKRREVVSSTTNSAMR